METFDYVPGASHTVWDEAGNLLFQVSVDDNGGIENITIFIGSETPKSIGTIHPKDGSCALLHGVYASSCGLWSICGALSKRYDFCAGDFRFIGVTLKRYQ